VPLALEPGALPGEVRPNDLFPHGISGGSHVDTVIMEQFGPAGTVGPQHLPEYVEERNLIETGREIAN
jgi:hypothetical protein